MNAFLMYHNIKLTDKEIRSDYDMTINQLEDDIEMVKVANSQNVRFTFDDGQSGSLLAANLLSQSGISGIFFIITNKISTPGYLSKNEVKEIHEMGHVIASHSHTDTKFNKISDHEVEYELKISKEILQDIISEKVTSFAYPGGKRKRHHSLIARDMGFEEVFNSFERYARQTQIEIPRFHVRQSTRNCVSKIIKLNKGYLLQRYLRSILVEIKDAVK